MAVKRISNININDKGLFTAIYGNTADDFIDSDLRNYLFEQQLYLYLKTEGYYVFFQTRSSYEESNGKKVYNNNVYSYSEDDIKIFFNIGDKSQSTKQNADNQRTSPFGVWNSNKTNMQTSEAKDYSKFPYFPENLFGQEGHKKWNIRTPSNLNDLTRLFNNHTDSNKVAYIVLQAETYKFDENYYSVFDNWNNGYSHFINKHKFIMVYGFKDKQSLADSLNGEIYERLFFEIDSKNRKLIDKTTYFVSLPDKEEIVNLLNEQRLTESLSLNYSIFDKYAVRLTQKRLPISQLKSNLQQTINNIDGKSAWDKLNKLIGIEPIITQLKNLVAVLKEQKERKEGNKEMVRFRPHVVFKGSPGTGKTTVAKLFANILQEEGVLPIGHSTLTKPKDFLAGYEGGAREKADELCEKAKGGVLFIDEAYGIINRGSNPSEIAYGGTDVCEVLLTFMEDNDDSILIIAGYEADINNFISQGNDGFQRRFINKLHIKFDDYPLNVLFDILYFNIKKSGKTITDDAIIMIKKVLEERYNKRTEKWGNAGEVENLLSELILGTTGKEVIDTEDLPDEWKKVIRPIKYDWTALSKSLSEVYCQQDNTELILKEVKSWLREPLKDKPLVFLLAGTSGTGKTFTAQKIADGINSFGYLYRKFNMNEYSNQADVWRFLGSSTGHIGSEKTPPIFALREQSDRLVLVFDEIEKAHEKLLLAMMTLLDEGI